MDTLRYGGPVTKSDGQKIVLPEQDFVIDDTIEPDPSVGIFGEPGVLLEVPLAVDPEGVVYVSATDFDAWRDA